MKNTLVPLAGIGSSEDRQSNIMALLDLYGPSYFVDAVRVCQFEQTHNRLDASHGDDDFFWDCVKGRLEIHPLRK